MYQILLPVNVMLICMGHPCWAYSAYIGYGPESALIHIFKGAVLVLEDMLEFLEIKMYAYVIVIKNPVLVNRSSWI